MFSQPPLMDTLNLCDRYLARHTWYFHLTRALFFSFLLCLVVFVLLGIYNRYFHPLRNIPGPFWSSVTDFYKIFVLSSQDVTQLSLKLHERYGSIVRVAPNMLSFSDPLDVPLVYHRDSDKNDFWTHGFLGEHPPIIQTLDHKEHIHKRKIMASTLSMKSLLKLEEVVDDTATRLYDTFQSRFVVPKQKLDLSNWARWYLYDTTASLIFGKKIGFIDEGRDVHGLLNAFRGSVWFLGLMAMFPYLLDPIVKLPIIRRFALPHSGDKRGVGKIMKYRDRLVEQSRTNDRKSLLKSLKNTRGTQGKILSDDDLNAELLLMMVAAPDTTSALICAVINQVLQSPDVHTRLISEITAAAAAGKLNHPVATFNQIKELPFFTACIQESARLFPSIPVVIPRRVSRGGLVLKGFFIPEGTAIGASAVVVNRDPEVFGADAAAFRPERWLGRSDRVARMHRMIFSWGFSTRKCIGKNLALLETYKFCFQLFRRFEMTSASPGQSSRKHEDTGFAVYDDQFVYLKNRKLTAEGEESNLR